VRPIPGDVENGPTHWSAPTDDDSHMNTVGVPLGYIIRWFKTMTTNEYIRHVKLDHWKPFPKRLWHRSYWEHVIRNERALDAVRRYIARNLQRWDMDCYNPNAKRPSK
jgi:hypothetical protein